MKNCQHQELVSKNMHTDAAKDMDLVPYSGPGPIIPLPTANFTWTWLNGIYYQKRVLWREMKGIWEK